MSSNSSTVDDLYQIAIDPDATQEQLRYAWDSTKSTRVRKAVASNPNCDSATMCMAARLYLKEVIANPSFELLNLFQEDKFVKRIHEAYTDPAEFYKGTQLPSIRNTNGNRINLARALLVSPNLRSAKIVQDICAALSGAEFSRELKDPDVRDNVRAIVTGNLGYFGLSCLMFLMHHGVIDMEKFDKALSKSPGPHLYYTPKGTYTKFVEARTKQSSEYRILFQFIYVNRAGNVRDLIKEVRSDPGPPSYQNLDTYADLYRDFLLHDVVRNRKKNDLRKSQYGWYGGRTLNDDDICYHLSDLVWSTIVRRNIPAGTSFDQIDLEAIFRDVSRVGFDRDFGPFRCEVKLGNVSDTITGRNKMCEKLLALKDDRAFEFFATSGMIWTEWYGRNEPENLESKVVDRLNRINERKFGSGDPSLLFRFSDLDYFPTISVNQTNGLEYDSTLYKLISEDNNGVRFGLPSGSGRLKEEWIVEMADRGVS
jgi:hypothetical protein